MTRNEIEQTLIQLAAEQVSIKPDTVTAASHFINDLEFDSLDTMDYAMKVEDAFRVNVPDDQFEKLQTVKDVVDLVVEQTAATAAQR